MSKRNGTAYGVVNELRKTVNPKTGRPHTLREIAEAAGASHSWPDRVLRRGAGGRGNSRTRRFAQRAATYLATVATPDAPRATDVPVRTQPKAKANGFFGRLDAIRTTLADARDQLAEAEREAPPALADGLADFRREYETLADRFGA
jgi:hypothetical protein